MGLFSAADMDQALVQPFKIRIAACCFAFNKCRLFLIHPLEAVDNEFIQALPPFLPTNSSKILCAMPIDAQVAEEEEKAAIE
jgi:hypothetical protein